MSITSHHSTHEHTPRGRRRVKRLLALPLAGALVVGLTGVFALGAPANADPAPAACGDYGSNSALAPGEADFDGDGQGDIAYGEPVNGTGGVAGRVVVQTTRAPSTTLTTNDTADGAPVAGDRFGTVVRTEDVDADFCTDLIVSAPGRDHGSGRVYVIFGAPGGLGTGRASLTVHAPKITAGDRFGAALDTNRLDSDEYHQASIVVGAPGTDVAGAKDAGAVYLFHVSDETNQVDRAWSWSQGAKGVGTAETGDHFGEVLTLQGQTVVVGVPREDIGSRADAGVVDVRTVTGTIRSISQSTKGVSGSVEGGDRFGAALATSGRALAVGAPGEGLGTRKHAGQVQLFTQTDASYRPVRALTLDTKHMAGAPRTNDVLGSSLAILHGLQYTNGVTVAAGIPNRTNTQTGAGAVALFELTPSRCPKKAPVCGRVITQATIGVSGTPAHNAHFGSVLAVAAEFGPTSTAERRDALLIGTPRGSYAGMPDAGVYVKWRPVASSLVIDPAGVHPLDGFGGTVPAQWTSPSLYR